MRFFFYGTLMSGFGNNTILTSLPGSEKLCGAVVMGYGLRRRGGIPIAVYSDNPREVIHGEVWEVDNPYAVAALHNMEVGAGYKAVTITALDETRDRHDCYMYVLDDEHYRLPPTAEYIPGNNYREWRKTWNPSTEQRRSSSSSRQQS